MCSSRALEGAEGLRRFRKSWAFMRAEWGPPGRGRANPLGATHPGKPGTNPATA